MTSDESDSVAPTYPPTPTAAGARILAHDTHRARFTPGAILADRYRVVGLLGRGGMGEVYRADDLKLGTPVALKFLPRALAVDSSRRERFLAEVRVARDVAHPNVCRVYDIGDIAGVQFLSMEYIDGEDLASLLKRIGRLPPDKALDIARQIAAGLAAAHDRGVLHRDLKPANIMLDGRGRVRITDFGLAIAADAPSRDHDISGTPAYMAPEQFAGERASVRSDIYALGLVLYELYTGRHAFPAVSLEELIDRKRHDMPVAPSKLVADMDPAVERVILAAVANDPRERPASLAQLIAALPGLDPLEAALRAGQTPSPEMVAAAGGTEGISAASAALIAAVVVVGAVTAALVGAQAILWRRAALDRSPEVLAEKARDLLTRIGYPDAPYDRAYGFVTDVDYLRFIRTRDSSRARWNQINPSFFRFWYRESPQPLETWRFVMRYGNFARVDLTDPPLDVAGMTRVELDPTGKLLEFVAVPVSVDDATAVPAPPDWSALLTAAGYSPNDWRSTEAHVIPPFFADARAAWHGTWPNRADIPVRIEAAALRGRVVYFSTVFPWSPPPRVAPSILTAADRSALVLVVLGGTALLAGALVLATRNVRAGRGDRRGALRLSTIIFVTQWTAWFFGEKHVAAMGEITLVVMACAWALLVSAGCWIGYLAAEPFVRRRWPRVLVSWTRALGGRVRDPLVGRDVLIGCAAGTIFAVLAISSVIAPSWFGYPAEIVPADIIGPAYGLQRVVPLLLWRVGQSVFTGLAAVFVVLVLRLLLRRQWAAMAGFVLLSSVPGAISSDAFWVSLAAAAILNGLFATLLLRAGLVATVLAFYVSGLFIVFPVTLEFSRWYAGAGVTALLVLAGLTTFGVVTATDRGARSPRAATQSAPLG